MGCWLGFAGLVCRCSGGGRFRGRPGYGWVRCVLCLFFLLFGDGSGELTRANLVGLGLNGLLILAFAGENKEVGALDSALRLNMMHWRCALAFYKGSMAFPTEKAESTRLRDGVSVR